MRGSEAIIEKTKFDGTDCLVKIRNPKKYRNEELDESLRRRRTKAEAKILGRVYDAKINCPKVLRVEKFKIFMSEIKGERAKENKKNLIEIAKILNQLHNINIYHGDFTLANIIENSSGLFVIDFGLSKISKKIEDKAIDVFTFYLSIQDKKLKKLFLDSYLENSNSRAAIEQRIEKIRKRVRYAD